MVDGDLQLTEFNELRAQARRGLESKAPSLRNQYNYYMKMADDSSRPWDERMLWKQLAEELAKRLPDDGKEDQLPFDVKYTPRNRRTP